MIVMHAIEELGLMAEESAFITIINVMFLITWGIKKQQTKIYIVIPFFIKTMDCTKRELI